MPMVPGRPRSTIGHYEASRDRSAAILAAAPTTSAYRSSVYGLLGRLLALDDSGRRGQPTSSGPLARRSTARVVCARSSTHQWQHTSLAGHILDVDVDDLAGRGSFVAWAGVLAHQLREAQQERIPSRLGIPGREMAARRPQMMLSDDNVIEIDIALPVGLVEFEQGTVASGCSAQYISPRQAPSGSPAYGLATRLRI